MHLNLMHNVHSTLLANTYFSCGILASEGNAV